MHTTEQMQSKRLFSLESEVTSQSSLLFTGNSSVVAYNITDSFADGAIWRMTAACRPPRLFFLPHFQGSFISTKCNMLAKTNTLEFSWSVH